MTLKIPTNDEATLVLAIAKAISRAKLFPSKSIHGIDREWESELVGSLDPSFAKALDKTLDDGGLTSFIRDYLSRKIILTNPKLPKSNHNIVNVVAIDEFAQPLVVAEEIVGALKRCPESYALAVRFSKPLSDIDERSNFRFKISDRLEIVSADIAEKEVPLVHDNVEINRWIWGISNKDIDISFEPDSLYFIYRASGVISDKFDSKLARDFADDLRAFYGACFAFGILFNYGDSSAGEVLPRVVSININGDDRVLWHMQPLDTDLIRATYVDTSIEFDKRVEEGSLEQELAPISKMFQCPDSARLKNAASWLLRANLSDRDMDRVLESTIALEVLLGDKDASDRIGLSRLMANRCAYSLGKSAEERRELNHFFTQFYKVRSDIVHSGTFKVSDSERATVRKGLNLAHRVLRHEVAINS